MDKPVVAGAEDDQLVFTWKRLAALRDRIEVMRVQDPQALSGDPGEGAASAGAANARAKLPPGLSVVQGGHGYSPTSM